MGKDIIIIEVFGANVICASCVNAPSSKDTYEWLEAAISRKYPNQPFSIDYIDIDSDLMNDRHKIIAAQVQNDEYFYPLVMIDGKVVGEGNIQLKPIFNKFEKRGYLAKEF